MHRDEWEELGFAQTAPCSASGVTPPPGCSRKYACRKTGNMDQADEVMHAARNRAAALALRDARTLEGLLHPDFRWISHTGQTFDRTAYIQANTSGKLFWRRQELSDVAIVVTGDTGVLWAMVTDEVEEEDCGARIHRMPMTQVWVRTERGWKCLAGHAGPRQD